MAQDDADTSTPVTMPIHYDYVVPISPFFLTCTSIEESRQPAQRLRAYVRGSEHADSSTRGRAPVLTAQAGSSKGSVSVATRRWASRENFSRAAWRELDSALRSTESIWRTQP